MRAFIHTGLPALVAVLELPVPKPSALAEWLEYENMMNEEQRRMEEKLRDSFYAGVLSGEIKVSPGARALVEAAHRRLSSKSSIDGFSGANPP